MHRRLFLALLLMLVPLTLFAATVQLPETGQTTIYAANDDGTLQKGVAWPTPRFIDNGNGTVTDHLTDLIWLKNANCFGEQAWANALSSAGALASGSCGLTDGSVAGAWRLPNENELESLINIQQANSATWLNHPDQKFTNVQIYGYWSASTYPGNPSNAWNVGMRGGSSGAVIKTYTSYVWPVRGGQSSTLSVILAGTGSGVVAPDSGTLTWASNTGTASYPEDTVVTLTATPDTGATFTGWSGGGCSGTGSCVTTLGAHTSVTATFLLTAAQPIGIYAATTNTTGSYQISWNQSATAGVTYKLYQTDIAEPIYSGLNNYFNVTGMGNGTYSYSVKATKTDYPDSALTGPVTTTVTLAVGPIAGIYAPTTNSTGSYQVSWNIVNTAGVTYELYENNGTTNPLIYSGPNNKFIVTGKLNGPYSYTVKATKAGYVDSATTASVTTTVTNSCGNIIGIYGPTTNITGGSYQISWNIVNTAGVTYELYENNGATNPLVYSGPNNKVIISGKTSGTYSYTVKATKAGIADSALTGPISTTIVVGNISGIVGPTSNTSGLYNISWNRSVTAGVTYMLYENNGTTNTLAYSGPNNNFTFSGKTNGTYSYTVKATKAGIVDSALTGPISTTVVLACGNIYGFYVPTSSIFGSSYQISWYSGTAGVTYELYEDNGTTNTLVYSGPNNNVTMSGKPIGTYSYTVKATKAGIPDSALAGPISTTVTDTCENIFGIYGPTTSINGSYQISWNSSGTDGVTYALYEDNGTTNTLVYSGPSTNFTFSGKTNGTYSYTVKAIKAGGIDSALTGPISTTVTVSLGNIIGIYGPTTNISGSYQISWNIVNNVGVTYKLYENGFEIYSGPNNKVTLSGKANGTYSYTVKATKVGWSDSPTRGTVTTTVNLTCGSILGIYGPTTSISGNYQISWNRSATAGVTYELYENNGTDNTLIYSGPNNYVTLSGKGNGTYSYTVKATKAGIVDSPIKGTVTTTVTITCGSIIGIYGPTTSTSGSYNISWNRSVTAGVTYELYENDGITNAVVYSGTNNNVTLSGKTNGTYNYTVKAIKAGWIDSALTGPISTTVTVSCANIIGIYAPTTTSTGSYTVSWDNSTSGSTYVLEESVNSGIWTTVAPGPGTMNYHDFTGKPAGSYSYRVTATKSGYNPSDTRVLVTPVTVTTP